MTIAELPTFTEEFKRLRTVFALRGEPSEITRVSEAYFKAMARFPLDAVRAGAEYCLTHGTRFPKPAEWIRAIPSAISTGEPLPSLTYDEAVDYRRAERLNWQDDPCRCVLCTAAGVSHRFLRFVPESDDLGECRALLDDRPVTRGHWAHGLELRSFYEARDRYLGLAATILPRTFPARPKASDTVQQVEAWKAQQPKPRYRRTAAGWAPEGTP